MEQTNGVSDNMIRRIRRRLFQDDSEVNSQRLNGVDVTAEIQEQLVRDRENAKLKWNFDFENEVPLPGRYQWVKHNDQTLNFESEPVSRRLLHEQTYDSREGRREKSDDRMETE